MNLTKAPQIPVQPAPVLREELGEVLRAVRRRQGRTLREVSAKAQVSLGYLSEVERGQKEASSELLAAICKALGIPMALLLREVSERIAIAEGIHVPDTVPDELVKRHSIQNTALVASE
ncbi:MAG: helix-turn-helix transcriptional regulator [Actinomycetaceae bacterium]|nr:helix-turn-helix transcriptional regulator [Actinomycetaceae bacterium]